MSDKTDIQIKIKTKTGEITIPESSGLTLKSEENLILPFNFDLGGVNLIYATAQILTRVGDEKNPCFIFFVPGKTIAQFSVERTNVSGISVKSCKAESDNKRWLISCSGNSEFRISRKTGGGIRILIIDKDLALKSWLINIKGAKYLVFSDALLLEGKDSFEFYNSGTNSFNWLLYPKISFKPQLSEGTISDISKGDPLMSEFKVELPLVKFEIKTERFGENKLQLSFPKDLPQGLSNVFIRVNYIGDTGMSFMNGELVDDQFYYGQPWVLGLKKFYDLPQHQQMNFYFRPMYRNATYLVDLKKVSIPDFTREQSFLKVN